MKPVIVFLTMFLYLSATMFSPTFCADLASADTPFKTFIDERRTLHLEGTDAAETIIATVIGDPAPIPSGDSPPVTRAGRATIVIEYRSADGTGEPQKSSFSLEAFDRVVLNARRGDDFVNIVDPAELLDATKKILTLDGGDGDNVVVLSHLSFKPETAVRLKRLTEFSKQLDDIAKRAGDATSAALMMDAMKGIDAARINLADVSKSMAAAAETQIFSPARRLVEGSGPQLTALGNSFVTKSDDLAKRQGDLVSSLTKTYDPTNGVYPPDDNNERRDVLDEKADVVRPDPNPGSLEKEDDLAQARAEQLSQEGLKLGTDARDQIDRSEKQMESSAAAIEQRAAEFEKSAKQLSTTADALAAQDEKDLTTGSARILAVVAELRSMEKDFQEAGMTLRDELQLANSMTVNAKQAKVAAKGAACSTPIVTTNTYTGGSNTDIFFPFSAPSQSWSINGGGGTDFLFGGFADDDIHGGPGTDFICGLKGDDQIHGDDGTDFLFGEFFIDFPSMTGNDCIWGDDGVDLVVGDNFIDTPSGTQGGDDFLWGGKGTDIVIGDDVLDVPNFPNFNVVLLEILSQTHAGGKDTMEGNDDMDLMFGDGGDDPAINGNAEMDFVEGNGGDDIIYGDDGRDFQFCNTTVHVGNLLMGGNDKDEVHGGKGIDVIFGDDGDDKLFGADQVDIMFGGRGADEMHGDAGGQICTINNVPIRLGNLMFGGIENDRMWAGGDLDVMFGQDGDDKIYGYDGSGQQPFAIDADLLFGGNGNDYMEGDDESIILLNSIDFMFGGDNDDEMHGGSQPDLMFGQNGQDKMYGDSNSLLRVASVDLMFGGPDDDFMDGGNAMDVMFGQDGNDTMLGDDESPGLISSDVMFGGPGDDVMNGGCTSDFMSGGDGADHMLGDSNYWWEPLSNDFMLGNSGNDYMDGGNAMDFMFGGPDCDTMLGDNNTPWRNSPDFMFGEGGNDDMDGGNSTDFMWAGDGNDRVVGDQDFWWQLLSRDWMWGEGGCDTMLGGTALDWMWGDPGVDQMDGQAGSDMMFGGAQSDTMNGGAGPDFIWGNDGNDLIHGDAFIDLIWGGDGDDCLYGDDGQDLIWGGSGEDCVHGGSHADGLHGGDGDDLIFGDNGPDRLWGDNGDDKLDGGNGADLLVGGPGTDELWGGPGLDLMFGETKHQSGSSGLECDCHIETCMGRICVHKFNDLNGDGIQNNGEVGLQNWAFQVASSSCTAGATLVTDAQGNACGDFYPGTYSVVEQVQSGWTPTTSTTQSANVTAGSTADVTFGNKRSGRGELCVFKFNDLNGNGIRDNSEPLIPNWPFTATDSNGASTPLVTHAGGGICSGFPAGPVTVVETLKPGWTPTTATTQTVTLSTNQATNVYFGNWVPSSAGLPKRR